MNAALFKNSQQESLFTAVLKNLKQLGYTGELLKTNYAFVDWFESDTPERVVPAAAFGQMPQSYDSACFSILLSNGRFGAELVAGARALGAPYAFEVRDNEVISWLVGRDESSSRELLRARLNEIDRVFAEHRKQWAAIDVLRSKGITFKLGPRQLDFIDLGLIPALEHQISLKLDRILREIVQDALKLLKQSQQNNPDALRSLYRLIFRFLAGKILHDRDVMPFRNFNADTAGNNILDAVAKYYGEQQAVPKDSILQKLVSSSIWTQLDFRNLSAEVLAYIYENTFVNDEVRQKLGTHGTPHAVARYIVHQIPFDRFSIDQRQTLEPFCGHGVFLVAALQRLRELLPTGMGEQERHKYFVQMLRGFEIDEFALEVSRLCLMLADFPNHNGWKLDKDDVFDSERFSTALSQSRIVLSNPPFEDFTTDEKKQYLSLSSKHKPVELLNRIFGNLPADGVLGIVLPQPFIDGKGYRSVRQELTKRFEAVQIVSLPDGVFKKSDVETALVIATTPRSNQPLKLTISFTQVARKDRRSFLTEYAFTRRDEIQANAKQATESLNVVALRELWNRLSRFSCLGQFSDIHRGVEWLASDNSDTYVSVSLKPGFRKGVYNARNLLAFEQPETRYLCFQPECLRRLGGFHLPWNEPKVFINAARISRGPWAIAAFSDTSDLISNSLFHALWPRVPWTLDSLLAVLNSPVANAYVAVHDFKRHIRKQTLKKIPLPPWGADEIKHVELLVREYRQTKSSNTRAAKEALLAIDAFVLKSYALPPRLERELLDLFNDVQRPVPFEFHGYFPKQFTSNIPLWMYLSPEFRKCSARYFLEKLPIVTDPSLVEALEEAAY